MTQDLKALRALCDAATQANARFIAATDPQTVLALLDEIETLRELREYDKTDREANYRKIDAQHRQIEKYREALGIFDKRKMFEEHEKEQALKGTDDE